VIREERRWARYRGHDNKNRERFLRALSEKDGFNILKDLYEFAYRTSGKSEFAKPNKDKIKTLAEIHSRLNGISS